MVVVTHNPSRMRSLQHGLAKIHAILGTLLRGRLFGAFCLLRARWAQAVMDEADRAREQQWHERQMAQHTIEAQQARLDHSRQQSYHEQIVEAAESLVEGTPSQAELDAAELMLWTLRASRDNRLDLCVDALELVVGAIAVVAMRHALKVFRINTVR